MTEYETPDIFQDSDEDEIHARMLAVIPDNIDTSEGSIVWDLTRPTAIEVSRFKGWDMDHAIQMIFPIFATDKILDYHGESRGIKRKEAISANGVLTITGIEGAEINAGDLFSTESINDQENVSYAATQSYTIPSGGSIDIDVICTEAGTIGNTPPNTVILVETTNELIESVTNSDAITGGYNEESDEDYRVRIMEYDSTKDVSYVGSITDYRRWANEVPGVGNVTVIPATDNSGTVTLIIIDANGDPAGEELCSAVYNHIMRPDDPFERLAPINTVLVVSPPLTTNITVSSTVELSGATMEEVEAALTEALTQYFHDAVSDNEIRYTKVSRILGGIAGVYDYKNLLINGSAANVAITSDRLPVLSSLSLTPGSV